jgi:hypothetical protein
MKQLVLLFLLATVLFSCKKDEDEDLKVKACFGTNIDKINDGIVQFTNCSENAKSYFWDFGDGKTSTEFEPKHVYSTIPVSVTLIAFNGDKSDTIVKPIYSEITVYKPNIYIYPLLKLKLSVQLSFPLGGNIVESIPQYVNGWDVTVDTNGKINNQYDYLFYESKQPNLFQYEKGWCIGRENLKAFFEDNMARYNFSFSEIKDFTDYWMPLLTENKYYCIYPQTNEIIDKIIQLNFSVKPDHTARLFYGIVGVDELKTLTQPFIEPFDRSGFYVVEWGVFRK